MKRASLAYVVSTLNTGGTERLVVEMSLTLAAQFDIVVVCLDEPGLWAEQLRRRQIPVYCVWRQPGKDLSIPGKLAGIFRRHEVQLIHAHQATPWFYAALSRLVYRTPRLLFEEHGRFYPEVDSLSRRIVNRSLINALTHRFVAVSADVRDRLGRFEAVPVARIEVIHNGVAASEPLDASARAQLRERLGFAPGDFVVGTVGRFDPIKNLPMLVKGIASVGASQDRTKGLLVGDGLVFEQIRALVADLNASDRIRLTGYRSDARQLVQCMDLFVLPSFSEGISIALLEAMAAGVPAAVTDVGGNPEVVVANETGWVFPSDNVECLTQVLVEASADRDRLVAFARAARSRFQSMFAFDRMIARYAAAYAGMLGDPA